jgi:glycosyltransferase involved in cell wall biosynthesis
MLEPGALGFSRWKKRLALMVYQGRDLRLTRALHATAEPERQTLRDFGLRQPIAILPPGVRLPSVELTSSREGEGRRALFLGRIHPKKGLLNLLEAWSVVHPVDWKLDLAGPDESGHLKEVLRVLKERKLEGKVIYHGPAFDTTKEDLLRGSSLLVVPSLSENFGIVVAEGLAHGLPVITTQGTPWKALEQEDCGWWIPFGTEPLVKVLREATALPPEKLAEKGRRGRALAERDFSWQRIGVRMAKTYDWLLGRGERPVWVQTTEKGHCELPVVVHS